ncbi:MAG TPA: class I SAM-dependent methyltransferase [Steroidobacteraceae bacterium]|jgi:SAM-dependent methyltransferase|nr:class I SAM-dependent methyltransferase [Steroidobacteraceae bacterium]
MLYQNPDLYDALLPVSDNQLKFYEALAQRARGGILELACGTGQIIVPIAATGMPAVGLDLSAEMVEAARRRARAAGVRVDLVEADMRDFDLHQQFSLIFIARNSLLHLSEQHEFTAFFAAVRRHLAPGGVLAFDIFKPNFSRRSLWSGERVPAMRKTSPLYGELTVEETSDYDTLTQVNRATWFISTSQQRDAWIAPLHLRWIFPQELLALLAANGLHLVSRDGDYAGGGFTRESQLQVCRCQAGP